MPVANPDSVLDSVKQVLGLTPDMTSFDLDIAMHVNAVIGSLQQFGVNSDAGLFISDNTVKWTSITTRQDVLNFVKTYVYMRVRFIFDPPASGFAISAIEKQVQELEWRIVAAIESGLNADDAIIFLGTWYNLTGLLDFPAGSVSGDAGVDFGDYNIYVNDVISGSPYWWDLTGLSDFPLEAKIGDFGFDRDTGDVYEKVA